MENLKTYEEFFNFEEENEGWKTAITGVALGASLLVGSPTFAKGVSSGDNIGIEMIQKKQYNQVKSIDGKEALKMAKKLKNLPGNLPIDSFFKGDSKYNVVVVIGETQSAAQLSIRKQLKGRCNIHMMQTNGAYVGFQKVIN